MSLSSYINNQIAGLLKSPPYIILFLNDTCWLNCSHCWYNQEWKKTHLKGPLLSFCELQKIARSLKRIHFLSFAGGEAFKRDDFVSIAKMFIETTNVSRFDIPTSGFMPELIVEKTKELLRVNTNIPFRVNVSLDGLKKTHNSIRGSQTAYQNAVDTIQQLSNLSKDHKHFDVGVITTISFFNQNEVDEIANVVKEILPRGEWMVNITRGETSHPQAGDVSLDAYKEADRIINRWIMQNEFNGHKGHRFAKWLSAKNATRRKMITDIIQNRYVGGSCTAGTLAGVIQADGSVWACEMLDLSLGNLRTSNYDLPRLWRSGRAKDIREQISRNKCKCTHECFLSVSLLAQPRYWPELIKQRFRVE